MNLPKKLEGRLSMLLAGIAVASATGYDFIYHSRTEGKPSIAFGILFGVSLAMIIAALFVRIRKS